MTVNLVTATTDMILCLGRGLLNNGHPERARELVEALRITCDELTAEINDAVRKGHA